MTLQDKIYRDLLAGQSSIDALSLRVKKPKAACEIILKRMEGEKLVYSFPIPCGITVWRLWPSTVDGVSSGPYVVAPCMDADLSGTPPEGD